MSSTKPRRTTTAAVFLCTSYLVLLITLAFASPIVAQADEKAPAKGAASGSSTVLENPLPTADISTLVGNVLRALFGILGSLALLMFIYGGFTWLTSGGAAEKIQKGKDTMVWAALGIAITFAAYAIVGFVIAALTAGK